MRNILFTPNSFEDYTYWQGEDRKTLKRINALLIDIMRNGAEFGIGKPESLRERPGLWSRRIDEKNRLIYAVKDDVVIVIDCRSHYGDH